MKRRPGSDRDQMKMRLGSDRSDQDETGSDIDQMKMRLGSDEEETEIR